MPRALVLAAACLALAAVALALAGQGTAAAGLEAPALLQDRGPIRIDGDHHFDAEHGVRGGAGTAEDPYRIANWRIQDERLAIRVANTTKHFVVRNNQLTGLCDLASAQDGCVFEAGMHLQNLSAGTASVVHNAVRGMDRAGISIEGVAGVEVVENLVEGGGAVREGAGILGRFTEHLAVRGNVVRGVGPAPGTQVVSAGIRVVASADAVVEGNRVSNGTETGLSVVLVRRLVAQDNELAGNHLGFAFQGLDGRFAYNNVTDSTLYGVLVARGNNWLHVERNLLARNGGGLEVQQPANVTARNNSIEGHRDFGLSVAGEAFADAAYNWWGAEDGPHVPNHTQGRGERIVFPSNASAARVVWEPFLRAPPAAGTVGAGAARDTGTRVAQSQAPAGAGEMVPVAVLEGPGQAFLHAPASFSGARSHDPEGGPLAYAWDFGDGSRATGMRATHAFNATGDHVVQLTVTDPQGIGASASIAVRVVREPLGVRLLVNGTASRGEPVLVRAEATGQPLGPVGFRFALAGPGSFAGEPSPASEATARFDRAGEHIVGVEATGGGERAVAFERVVVQNRPPEARAGASPANGTTATEFRLSGQGSQDPDGDELSYTWDLGGGRTASGAEVQHAFPTAGTHVVVLTVSDGLATDTAQVVVEVSQAPAPQEPARPAPLPAALALLALAAAASRPRRRGR